MILSPQARIQRHLRLRSLLLYHPPLHTISSCLLRPNPRYSSDVYFKPYSRSPSAKAGITKFAATLPSSLPPPENVEETMTTVDQGMSVEKIERVIAQRVANAIEAIAIYETKTNMAPEQRANTGKSLRCRAQGEEILRLVQASVSKCNYHHDVMSSRECTGANIVGPSGPYWHYKRDCLERKNQSHKNQIEGTRAHGVVHTLRGGETDQGPNNIKDGNRQLKREVARLA
ncbi:hypothetical protein Tco_1214373 [Tanacetum coccineum]